MTEAPATLWLLIWSGCFGLGVLAPLAGRLARGGRWQTQAVILSLHLALLGSLVAAAGAIMAFSAPTAWAQTITVWSLLSKDWLTGMPAIDLAIRVDALSAGFALLIAALAAVVTVYSFGALWARHFQQQRAWIAGAFNLFVWATLMVVIVSDLFSLIAVLEIMTLAFAALTLYKHDHYQDALAHSPTAEQRKDARLAPQIYLIVSHASTAFLLMGALLLAQKLSGISFDDLAQAAGSRSPSEATAIFLLVLAGLGIRAGLAPAHFWVPLVHPASPTTTHAFSLGIAIKIAIYLMIRFFFQFLEPQVWWGYLLLGVAVMTAVVNVWYAIASHDLKKALAYHSIENIGIIVAGVGAALSFQAYDLPALAGLALIAALYHLLNHAVFKGLLYLATGAIERQTGEIVDIERLGGLLRIWPWTAGTFLVGAVAIAGFPPFNGFISEWLALQALLGGVSAAQDSALLLMTLTGKLVLIVSAVLLAASFALTAFCFVKIAGLALLGQPRSDAATTGQWRAAPDVPWAMRSMMALLAGLCLALGIFPFPVVRFLGSIVAAITLAAPAAIEERLVFGFRPVLPAIWHEATTMFAFVCVACLLGLAAWAFSRLHLRGQPKVVQVETPWNCGAPYDGRSMQYTGAALSFLIRDLFGAGWTPSHQNRGADYLPARLSMSAGAVSGQPRAEQVVVEFFRTRYNHVIGWFLRASAQIEIYSQNGDIRRYLLYILLANLIVLSVFLIR